MKSEIKYELPIFSSNLEKDPTVGEKDMNKWIELVGVDENNKLREIVIQFNAVICDKHTSARFTPKLYDAYDRIVELIDSEWLKELKRINEEDFNYWNPKHYIMYLDGVGMFQFVAQSYEVVEHE